MEDDSNLLAGLKNDPLSIIDEKPELTTLVQATKLQETDKSSLSSKILSKLSKNYTCYTVFKILAYSFSETAFLLPYCLQKVGIVPYIIGLILISLVSFYIFYIIIDLLIKFNLFKNYHEIIRQNLGRKFTFVYFILNMIYHSLILILESNIFMHFILKLLILFGLDAGGKFIYYLIILLSLAIVLFPLSFLKLFNRPDFLYIIFIIFFMILNLTAFVFFIIYKFKSDINSKEEQSQSSNMNFFENASFDYFVCFSVFINIMGWQNQISRQLEEFKIKTSRRLFNILYIIFILGIILCLVTGFINTPIILENDYEKYKIKLFLTEYNEDIIPTLMSKILLIIFCILFNILITYRLSLIEENFVLSLKATIYKSTTHFKKMNKIIVALFKVFILLLSTLVILLIKDMTYIIILFGGIFGSILNFFYPTIIYSKLISKNSLVIKIAWALSLFVLIINIIGFILKLIFDLI